MEEYLIETPSIDYMNPHIQYKVQELINQSEDDLDYIKRCYMFVRDEIPHSWDIKINMVSRTASDVLKNKNRNMLDKIMSFGSTSPSKWDSIRYQLSTAYKSR